MLEKMSDFKDIALYVDRKDIAEQLLNIENSVAGGHYMLTFMGQFSAGKSTLINAILGRKILPEHVNETTALITYIMYGEDEKAELLDKSGTIQECSFDDVADLWQNGKGADRLEELDSIRIYLNDSLLRNGLVIADTPGINTILSSHIKKTAELINISDRIVYVMKKSLTNEDTDFLENLRLNGLKIIMVRTCMDNINTSDENPDKTVEEERAVFQKYTDAPAFFTSIMDYSKYNAAIAELRRYISENLATDTNARLKEAAEQKLSLIAEKLGSELEKKYGIICASLSNDNSAYESKKSELEEKGRGLEKILSKNKSNLAQKYENAKSSAKMQLAENIRIQASKAKNEISEIDFSGDTLYPEATTGRIENIFCDGCNYLRESYISEFNSLLKESSEQLMSELGDIKDIVSFYAELPNNLDAADDSVHELNDRIDALIMLRNGIEAEMEESRMEAERASGELESQKLGLEELQFAMEAVKEELDNYGEYVERYTIRKGSHKNEELMSRLGFVADIATILIPGEAWAKGAAAIVGKGASLVAKGAKAIEIGDKAADIARLLHMTKRNTMIGGGQPALPMNDYEGEKGYTELLDTVHTVQSAAPSIMDYLSLQFYFKKIGQHFDTPDLVVEDEEYRNEYDRGRKEIHDRYVQAADAAARKKADMLKITDRIELENMHQKELEKSMKNAERDETELRARLEEEKKNSYTERCRKYFSDMVREELEKFGNDYILGELQPDIDEKFTAYAEAYGLNIQSELNRQKSSLCELEKELRGSSYEEKVSEKELCQKYIDIVSEKVAL